MIVLHSFEFFVALLDSLGFYWILKDSRGSLSFSRTCEMYITFLLVKFSACGCKVQKVDSRPTSKTNSDQSEAEDGQIDTAAPLCLLLLLIQVSFGNIFKIILTLGGVKRGFLIPSSRSSTSSYSEGWYSALPSMAYASPSP